MLSGERCAAAICCASWRHIFISLSSHFPVLVCLSQGNNRIFCLLVIYDATVSCLEGKVTHFCNNWGNLCFFPFNSSLFNLEFLALAKYIFWIAAGCTTKWYVWAYLKVVHYKIARLKVILKYNCELDMNWFCVYSDLKDQSDLETV